MIEAIHLTKQYGNHTAVSDVSFTIDDTGVFGLLGPNGAGKSTIMNMMTGCLSATEGNVRINGHDIVSEAAEAKRLIGYLPEIPPLYPDRTPEEALGFVAMNKGLAKQEAQAQIAHAMEVTRITEVARRLCGNLSKGYKQRVGLAQAMIGNPSIIVLDEPTVGLDPREIVEIRELMRELGKERIVIFSSHILSEVEAICKRILVISGGKLLEFDTPENLAKKYAEATLVSFTALASETEVHGILSQLDHISKLKVRPLGKNKCQVSFNSGAVDQEDQMSRLFFAFSDIRRPLVEMSVRQASLEDLYIEMTDNVSNDQGAGRRQAKNPVRGGVRK